MLTKGTTKRTPLDPHKQVGLQPGRYINVRHCGGRSLVLLYVKTRESIPGSGFLPHSDMTYKSVESDVKTHSFLPSYIIEISPKMSGGFGTYRYE